MEMNRFFYGLFYEVFLPLTLMGSAATILLVCLQALFSRAGKHFSALLAWGIAALFFLLPVQPLLTGLFAALNTAFSVSRPVSPEQSAPNVFHAVSGPAQGLADGALRLAALSPTAKALSLAPILWLAGFILSFFLLATRLHRFSGHVKKERKSLADPQRREQFGRIANELHIKKAIPVYQLPGIQSPFACGLLHPAIYLPEKALPAWAEELAFRHELLHIKRGHLWLKATGESILLLHWLNPLARALKRKLDCACEMDCDSLVTKGVNAAERKAYGTLLLDLALAEPMQTDAVYALSQKGGQLSSRLLALRQALPSKQQKRLAMLLAVLLLLPCVPAAAVCERTVQSTAAGAALLSNALAHAEDFLPSGESANLQSARIPAPETMIALGWPIPNYRYCSRVQNSGLSIVALPQTEIVAAADGVVLATSAGNTEIDESYGQTVVLVHSASPDISTCYTHCAELFVQPGDTVKAGQVIAAVGSSGEVSGSMCRYQVLIDGILYNPARWYPDAYLSGDFSA